MKVGVQNGRKACLDNELMVVQDLQDSPFFPVLLGAGQADGREFILFEVLGPSLATTRRQLPGAHYTLPTALRLAAFMLQSVRELHHLGFVHRDITPSNFLLNVGQFSPLILIDFGVTRQFIDPRTGRPYPQQGHVPFNGARRYASPNAQAKKDQSPRDDLTSWLYAVVELAVGRLPWDGEDDSMDTSHRKRSISDRRLLAHLPGELMHIARYIRTLKYESVVNYDYLMHLVLAAVWRVDGGGSEPFDWELLPDEQRLELSAVPLPKASDYAALIPRVGARPVASGPRDTDTDGGCVVA
jgi:serine/threonine protein kinase